MKWGGRGVGTERSEGWIQKDMEGSGISSSLRSLSSVRMNADSECASCACVCLNLGVWLCCIFCVVRHWNGAKKPSQCYSHVRLTVSNSVKHQQRNLLYITEYLTEQAELSVKFYVTENLIPTQVRRDFSWFFSVAPYESWESTPN